MDSPDSSPSGHPSTDHDDTIEAHYAGLERGIPCGCYGGYHYIGHLVEDPERGEEGEIIEAVACRTCGEELRRLEEKLAHELLDDEERQDLRDRVLRLRRRRAIAPVPHSERRTRWTNS